MSWRFICDHSDVIASAAPAAFGHSADEKCFSKGVAPAREMPILYMHGTRTISVQFRGRHCGARRSDQRARHAKGPAWKSDPTHTWTRYKNANGTVFEFIQHDYTANAILGGHCYPGSTDPGGAPGQLFPFACTPPNSFIWGEAVIEFFLAHPM